MQSPIKSTPAGITKEVFYTIQENGNDRRYIISLNDVAHIEILINFFIKNIKKNLMGITLRDTRKPEQHEDYLNNVNKNDFLLSLIDFKDFIFHCGNHDLILRNIYNSEMLIFDQYGVLFIYPEQDYTKTLEQLNIPFKANEIIESETAEDKANAVINCNEELESFIEHFNLKKK